VREPENQTPLELGQLRCFVAVAEELHFGRAARRLNMTQPPLSRQIQLLEHVLGAVLFIRTNRSVQLSPAGHAFLPDARRLLRLAESAALHARKIASGQAGRLRIGFTAAAAYRFLPNLIISLRSRLPEVDLTLSEMVSSEQLEALASGEIDAGLFRPPVSQPELAVLRVDAEPLVAALPARHALARHGTLTLPDLDGQDFVMYEPGGSRYFHDLLVMMFTQMNVRPRFVQQIGQIHTMLALVRAGLGVALVPAAAAVLRYHDVRLRPIELPLATPVELLLVWRRDRQDRLLDALIEVARAHAGGGE
jgi:DNA-binding transcriptional LysR family regulator